jgi:hypothetical protein
MGAIPWADTNVTTPLPQPVLRLQVQLSPFMSHQSKRHVLHTTTPRIDDHTVQSQRRAQMRVEANSRLSEKCHCHQKKAVPSIQEQTLWRCRHGV